MTSHRPSSFHAPPFRMLRWTSGTNVLSCTMGVEAIHTELPITASPSTSACSTLMAWSKARRISSVTASSEPDDVPEQSHLQEQKMVSHNHKQTNTHTIIHSSRTKAESLNITKLTSLIRCQYKIECQPCLSPVPELLQHMTAHIQHTGNCLQRSLASQRKRINSGTEEQSTFYTSVMYHNFGEDAN